LKKKNNNNIIIFFFIEKGEQLMKMLNILDFAYDEPPTQTVVNQKRKRKGNKLFDEEISLPGNHRYYSDNTFDQLYDITYQKKKIKVFKGKSFFFFFLKNIYLFIFYNFFNFFFFFSFSLLYKR